MKPSIWDIDILFEAKGLGGGEGLLEITWAVMQITADDSRDAVSGLIEARPFSACRAEADRALQ